MTSRDQDLADRVRAGEPEALEIIVNELGGALKSAATRVLRDETLAEDVVQDTFVGFWNDPQKFDSSRGTLRTFLLTIAHRRAVDVVRSEVARTRRELKPPEPVHYDVEEEVWSRALSENVRSALEGLSDVEREAISLAYFGGLSYIEVATQLGAPEGTVKSRIRSGMKKLAVSMAGVETS